MRRLWRFSPAGFLIRAAVVAAAYLICHAAGMRQYVAALPVAVSGASAGAAAVALGAAYVLLYFAFVLVVPILVVGAGIFELLLRVFACPPTPAAASDQDDVH